MQSKDEIRGSQIERVGSGLNKIERISKAVLKKHWQYTH